MSTSVNSNASPPGQQPPSPGAKLWQCWNLALATVAIINLVAGLTGLSNGITLWPYFWHFLDAEALWQLGVAKRPVALLIDLLLPATAVTALLYAVSAGCAGKRRLGLQVSLTSIWVVYLVVWIGSSGESMAGLILIFSAYAVAAVLGVAGPFLVAFGAAALFSGKGAGQLEIWRLLSIFAPAIVAFSALGLHPSSPYGGTAARNQSFVELCNGAGVTYFQTAPGLTVDSIILLQDSEPDGPSFRFIELNDQGQTLSHGSILSNFKPKHLSAVFVGTGPYRRIHPNPAKAPSDHDLVEIIHPDAIAFRSYNKPEELRKAPILQSAVEVRLRVVVASTKEKIAEMVYVIDRINLRACGANNGKIIDEQSFVHDALSQGTIK
jgi:hypothetical protein